MSEYQHSQVLKPLTEQVFEWANEILWQCELHDPNVQTYGRRGKAQYGVDLTGLREDDPNRIVGIQCKLKGDGKTFDESELRAEVKKALRFKPLLSEYILCTTAPDDPEVQSAALELSQSASKERSIPLKIRVMGWGSLERLIGRHPKARNAFDPSHSGQGDRIEEISEELLVQQTAMRSDLQLIRMQVETTNSAAEAVEDVVDRQITQIAQMIETAPEEARRLLNDLRESQKGASGRIKFRIEANIANCEYALGDPEKAASGFIAALDYDPLNPKAQANKALGLLIQGDWDALKAFCESALSKDPENVGVAGYFIQGMHAMPTITAPLDHVPEPTHSGLEVMLALARFYLQRDDKENWYQAAERTHKSYPDNRFAQEAYADVLIERVVSASGYQFGYRLTPEQESSLVFASRMLDARWSELLKAPTMVQAQALHVPANLMLAKRLLGQLEAAAEVGRQAVDALPDELVLVEKLAAALLELEAVEEAGPLIERLELSSDTIMMRFHLFSRQSRWEDLKALVETHSDLFPAVERDVAQAACVLATLHLADTADRLGILTSGVQHAENDPRALAIIAQGARRFGFDGVAGECYEAARRAAEEISASFATRYAVAYEAEAQGDWRTIARMFYGHINMEVDSPDLRLLTQALINQYPVREQARSFFESLPEDLKSHPFYICAYGVMEINRGDFEAAVAALQLGFDLDPRLALLNPLSQALFRAGSHDELTALLSDESIDATPGDARERMRFAHTLNQFGYGRRAIALGYGALCDAADDPDLSQKYMGLILQPASDAFEDVSVVVGPGTYIEISNNVGARISGIVDGAADLPWGDVVSSSHDIISRFIGTKVDHIIEREIDFDVVRTWTLTLVQPAWLRAWYDLFENSEARFPGATSVVKIEIEDKDFSNVFAQIRRQGERDQKLLDSYRDHAIPLAVIAGRHQAGAVGFADFLLGRGLDVRTATGNADAFAQAVRRIETHGRRGAVLDGFTAWRAAQFKLLPLLTNVLGPLAIPTTELVALKKLVALQDADRPGRSMSTSYQDGQYFKNELNQAERAEIAAWMQARIESIAEACTVEPVTVPDDLPEAMERLSEIAELDFMAPTILAAEDRLLLSDDLALRDLSSEVFQTEGVWLQAAAQSALKQGLTTVEGYVELVQSLAIHHHGVVSLDFATLYKIYRTDDTAGLYKFEAMCRYLGHETADCVSHVRLACAFLNQIWATSLEREWRVPVATGQVVNAILGMDREGEWARWAALMIINLEAGPRTHLIDWCRSTSKPLSQALFLLRRIQHGK